MGGTGDRFNRGDSAEKRDTSDAFKKLTAYRKIIDVPIAAAGEYIVPSNFECRGISYDDDGASNDMQAIRLVCVDGEAYSTIKLVKRVIHPIEVAAISYPLTTARGIHLYA
jgi:hypothetical protein